ERGLRVVRGVGDIAEHLGVAIEARVVESEPAEVRELRRERELVARKRCIVFSRNEGDRAEHRSTHHEWDDQQAAKPKVAERRQSLRLAYLPNGRTRLTCDERGRRRKPVVGECL